MDGMVAVVRGLRDAGLAVTLLDNGKQFTLAPNCYNQPVADERATTSTMPLLNMQHGLDRHVQQGLTPHMSQIPHLPNMQMHMPYSDVPHSSHLTHSHTHSHTQPVTHTPHASHLRTTATDAMPDRAYNNSSTQAIDGRYASVYQTTVCKLKPTNPPVQLTEFPPQRPGRESLPGQDNFIVGGTGSGDTTYAPVRVANNYRGAMCWTDRRSVCSPRPSRQPDAFASSLRKYPTRMSPDRSSEIVERLVTYTQAKNYGKSPPRYQTANSQTRSFEIADQVEDRKCKSPSKLVCRGVDSPRPKFCEESPTREKRRVELDPQDYKRATYARSYDVRYLRDVSRMVRDNMKGGSCNPYHQPVCSVIRERHDTPPSTRRSMPEQSTPSMVNSEIQAAAQMVCREVSTTPRNDPPKRNVAVALTPDSTQPSEEPILTGAPFQPCREVPTMSSGYNEADEECFLASTYFGPNSEIKAVQTAFSSIDLTTAKKRFNRNEARKTKSQENINKNNIKLQDEILEWLQEIYSVQKAKLWSEKLKRLAAKLKKPGGEEKIKSKIKKFLSKVPSHFSDDDEEGQQFREQLPEYIVRKLKKMYLKNKKSKSKPLQFYTYAVPNIYTNNKMNDESNVRIIIKNWLNNIPIKNKDFLGRPISKEDILDSIVQRLQPFIVYRPECNKDYKCMLKSYIMEILNEIPLENETKKDKNYLNAVTGELVYSIMKLNRRKNSRDRSPEIKWTESMNIINDKGGEEQAIIHELEKFVAQELSRLLEVTGLVTNKSRIACMEMEIVGILFDAFNEIYKEDEVKFDICDVLKEVGRLNRNQAKSLSSEITDNFKDVFSDKIRFSNTRLGTAYSETYLVCCNPTEEASRLAKLRISEKCFDTCLKAYAKQISSQIEQWLFIVKDLLPITHHSAFREMAVTELADTIVKRFKYLELHPSVRGSVLHESEHLKFLIFKWIRKLAGEDKIQVIQHVPGLMKRIQMVPAPVFKSKSQENEKGMKSNTSSHENKYFPDTHVVKELYVEIFDWYYDLPYEFHYGDDRKVKKEYIKKLAETVEKNIKVKGCLDEVIDEEVDSWANRVLKKLPRSLLLEELKARIKNVFTAASKTDASMQVTTTTNNIGTKTDMPLGVSQKSQINYEEMVTEQIDEWLSRMSIAVFDPKMLQWAIKNLAADIIDRQKYLEMNPKCRGNDNAELENLKYQIFKWLNKVVSEDNMVPVTHAPELMNRLRCIKVTNNRDHFMKELAVENKYFLTNEPSFETIRPRATSSKFESTKTSSTEFNTMTPLDSSRRLRGFYGRHGRIEQYLSAEQREMNRLTEYSESSRAPSERSHNTSPTRRRWSKSRNSIWVHQAHSEYATDYSTFTLSGLQQGPFGVRKFKGYKSMYYANQYTDVFTLSIVGRSKKSDAFKERKATIEKSRQDSRLREVPVGMSLTEAYEYFDKAIKKICDDIPLDVSTPEKKAIADLEKRALFNGIWKTYFRLKSDPNIENDFTIFEDMLDARLDLMLDDMNHAKVASFRNDWKEKVILEITKLLECVHSIVDALPFRAILTEKFDRLFIRQYSEHASDALQHMFIMKIIDEYILSARYKTEDAVKANVYKQRLMGKLEQLAEYIKAAHSNEYSNVNTDQLSQEAYKVLGSVPLPDDQTLIEEANEILLGEEIEQWYDELPVVNITSDLDALMRHRVKEILIKKLSDIQRMHENDKDMVNKEMMREITEFLKRDAQLLETHQINIDFMAKELTNRLAGMRIRALDHNVSGIEGLFLTSFSGAHNDKRQNIVPNELTMENLPLSYGVPLSVTSQMTMNVGGLDATDNIGPCNVNEPDGVCCRTKAASMQNEVTQYEPIEDEQMQDSRLQDRQTQNSRQFEPKASEPKRNGAVYINNIKTCPVYRSSEDSDQPCDCLNAEGIYTFCKQKTLYW